MSQSLEDAAAPADTAPRSLWHDRNFLTMWGGQALSQFGAQITELALPVLAVLILHATEFEVGLLNAAGTAAFLIVGLPAGAWIDRMRKRHVMIVADGVRAVALAMLPLLWWLGVLQVWHMLVVALVMGVATVFFDVSYQSIVPSLVPSRQIAEANGKLESTAQIAGIVGPAAGGWLIAVITAPFALLATAATYVVSLGALSVTRDREVPAEPGTHDPLVRSVREGLAWVFGNPYLRLIVGTTTVSNFFSTVTFTLLPLLVLRTLGLGPEMMGAIFAAGSVGGLLGAMATPHISRWIGEARSIPVSAIGFSLVALLIPAAAGAGAFAVPILLAQSFLGSFFVLLYNITQVTFRQRITPPRLLGRMNASIRFCVWGVMPLAALAAGALGETLGIVPTMWIGAIGALLSALFVLRRRFLTRELPAPAV
ncbi:MFS transporter [Microbacterium telephonicum]|uniref:Putative MFS family arabinose efflux permease n=1 Tax=Microbacterium telephonicum TaxID=1714841 RepID=A0A498BSX3_9MICO|nr:MFS transporter [Microbacterium telephonicum]RLK46612.1 putative MFS family arabinose efflux permease [Microbacterium telephonicum]